MSDEEKKAIDHIKNYPINWLIENVNESAIKIVLTLIKRLQKEIECDNLMLKRAIEIKDRQSKEIEELKEDRKSYAEEYIHNNPWLYKQLNEVYILRKEAEQKERKSYIDGTNDTHKLLNKMWEDKIKAKIEVLNNKLKNADEIEAVFIIKQQQILQSLKE